MRSGETGSLGAVRQDAWGRAWWWKCSLTCRVPRVWVLGVATARACPGARHCPRLVFHLTPSSFLQMRQQRGKFNDTPKVTQ